MNLEQALQHLREGRRIRRSGWKAGRSFRSGSFQDSEDLCAEDLLADDWEVAPTPLHFQNEEIQEARKGTMLLNGDDLLDDLLRLHAFAREVKAVMAEWVVRFEGKRMDVGAQRLAKALQDIDYLPQEIVIS